MDLSLVNIQPLPNDILMIIGLNGNLHIKNGFDKNGYISLFGSITGFINAP